VDSTSEWTFPPFRLDLVNARLWRDGQAQALRPKTFAVLNFLLEHPGRLIGKAELLDAVWGHRHVSESVLEGCISELRKALDDDPKAPRYIETAARRGYRFLAVAQPVDSTVASPLPGHAPLPRTDPERWVRREALLAQLVGQWRKACRGERRMVFLSGEAGLGKTTLIEMFVRQPELAGVQVLCGQCVDSYGGGEAFLPLLTALQQVGRQIAEPLRTHAPTWLAQMPSLLAADQRRSLSEEVLGATRERLVREGCDLLEALAAAPLVLVLEDLHWSDLATLDLLATLGRRRSQSALLVIGSYRPSDAALRDHPLERMQQELQTQRLCTQLPLDTFSYEELRACLERRLLEGRLPETVVRTIYRRTGGHPLFVVNLVDSLVAEDVLRREDGAWHLSDRVHAVPCDIQRMIEHQLTRLNPEDQRLLEAASAAGMESSAALLAAALEEDPVEVEIRCARLARRGPVLAEAGTVEWPDGTLAGNFAFRHALYAEVAYQRLLPAYRMALHRRLGERLEAAYGDRAEEVAAELARHFDAGRDFAKAVQYLRQAAIHSAGSFANHEALRYLDRALERTDRLPAGLQNSTRLDLLQQRALVHRSQTDWPRVVADLEAVAALARAEDRREQEVETLISLSQALFLSDRARCRETIELAMERSRPLADDRLRAYTEAHIANYRLSFNEWSETSLAAIARQGELARLHGDDEILAWYLEFQAIFSVDRTDYAGALAAAKECAELGLAMGSGFHHMAGQFFSGWALLHLGRWGDLQRLVSEGISSAKKNSSPMAHSLFHQLGAALHLGAQDFRGALALCERAPALDGDTYGVALEQLLRGAATLGLGRYPEAMHWLGQVAKALDAGALVETRNQLVLHHCLGYYWLAQRKPGQGRVEAERLLEIAAGPGDLHFLALGHRLLAQIATAEGKAEEAEAEIAQALAIIDGKALPLAACQVHAMAAEIRQASGRENEAREHRENALGIVHTLADSLDETPEGLKLRRSFLGAPMMRRLLATDSPPPVRS